MKKKYFKFTVFLFIFNTTKLVFVFYLLYFASLLIGAVALTSDILQVIDL